VTISQKARSDVKKMLSDGISVFRWENIPLISLKTDEFENIIRKIGADEATTQTTLIVEKAQFRSLFKRQTTEICRCIGI